MSDLEKNLDNLLAKSHGVSPSEVSCETIHKWREEHLYPNDSYNIESRYGGYITRAKKIVSRKEREETRKTVDEFLGRF